MRLWFHCILEEDEGNTMCENGQIKRDDNMKLPKRFDRASKIYAQNTFLRALIVSIPHIGGPLDVLFQSKGQEIIQKRVMNFLEDLKEEMDFVKNEMIDKEYLDSEEFFDLILKTLESVTRTRNRKKIRLYTKILRGAVTIQNRKQFLPEEYLITLSELTPREIEVATAIFEQQRDKLRHENENELQWAKRKGWDRLPEQCPNVPEKDLPFICLRLQKTGLIREIIGGYFDYEGGVFTVTETFRKLMNYLEADKVVNKSSLLSNEKEE